NVSERPRSPDFESIPRIKIFNCSRSFTFFFDNSRSIESTCWCIFLLTVCFALFHVYHVHPPPSKTIAASTISGILYHFFFLVFFNSLRFICTPPANGPLHAERVYVSDRKSVV